MDGGADHDGILRGARGVLVLPTDRQSRSLRVTVSTRVVGTAGHVDHGKSTLITALTGIDPDRLQEERDRGMTIDLGFAWLYGPIAGGAFSVVMLRSS